MPMPLIKNDFKLQLNMPIGLQQQHTSRSEHTKAAALGNMRRSRSQPMHKHNKHNRHLVLMGQTADIDTNNGNCMICY